MYISPEYNWVMKHATYGNFNKGQIKCPYEPRVYNKGYIGEGEYKCRKNGKYNKCYKTWHSMLQRCYDVNHHSKFATYKNCEVCPEWLNFQNFAKWYYENYYEIENERICLDKDILIKGNKIYSSNTCIFVPERINLLFIKSNSIRGELPIGVRYKKRNNKYEAYCGREHIYLGTYDTSDEAFYSYKNFKEAQIKEIAKEYEELIPRKLYEAMINYKVEIID